MDLMTNKNEINKKNKLSSLLQSIEKINVLTKTPDYLKQFQVQNSAIAKMAELTKTPDYLKQFQVQNSAIAKMAELTKTPDYLKQFQVQNSAIAKMAELTKTPDYLKQFQVQNSAVAKMAELMKTSLIARSEISNISDNVINAHKELIRNFNYIPAMAGTFADIDYEKELNRTNGEIDLVHSSDLLIEADKNNKFIQVFSALPDYARLIIFLIFWESIMPIFNSITANLLTPVVEEYIQNNKDSSVREVNNGIKRLTLSFDDIDTKGLRFISRKEVSLRAEPSIKSEFLDELPQGQIVMVLEKQKSWTEIEYNLESGEIMRGWVLTRFTKKFTK